MAITIEYAVESAEDQDGEAVGVSVTFEFDDVDSDDRPVTYERALEISKEILDGQWSSTTLL